MAKKQYPLRVDEELFRELVRLAADELRSVNAEIEYLLRQALAARGRGPGPGRRAPGDEGGAAGTDRPTPGDV